MPNASAFPPRRAAASGLRRTAQSTIQAAPLRTAASCATNPPELLPPSVASRWRRSRAGSSPWYQSQWVTLTGSDRSITLIQSEALGLCSDEAKKMLPLPPPPKSLQSREGSAAPGAFSFAHAYTPIVSKCKALASTVSLMAPDSYAALPRRSAASNGLIALSLGVFRQCTWRVR